MLQELGIHSCYLTCPFSGDLFQALVVHFWMKWKQRLYNYSVKKLNSGLQPETFKEKRSVWLESMIGQAMRSMWLDAKPQKKSHDMDQRSTTATAKPQQSKNEALFQSKLCGSFAHRKGSHYLNPFSSSFNHITPLFSSFFSSFFFQNCSPGPVFSVTDFFFFIIIILLVGWRSWEDKKKNKKNNKKITVQKHLEREMKNCETVRENKGKEVGRKARRDCSRGRRGENAKQHAMEQKPEATSAQKKRNPQTFPPPSHLPLRPLFFPSSSAPSLQHQICISHASGPCFRAADLPHVGQTVVTAAQSELLHKKNKKQKGEHAGSV